MTLLEYFWKTSHQIVILSPGENNENSDIVGWGSGFILKYKERFFFITCDHNLHMDDYDNEQRTGIDYNIGLICNCKHPNEMLSMGLITIPGFYYFEYLDGMYPELLDLKDLAFAEIKFPLPLPIYTNRLLDFDGETIIVAEGETKLFIDESSIGIPNTNDEYIITGCIRNEICNGIRMNRQNTFRDQIVYTGEKYCNSYLVFENPTQVVYDDWKGLSGSPVFNNNGNLIGMLNRVVEETSHLYVTPIQTILCFIDYTINHEKYMISLEESK